MKSLYCILSVILLFNNSFAQNWMSLNSGINTALVSVYFSDSLIGHAVGSSGRILKTSDGGNKWISENSKTSNTLNSVYFIDTTIGYIVGSGGTILKTTNGGSYWSVQYSGVTNDLFSVYFTDAKTGYAVGQDGIILKTTNGGSTWTQQTSPIYYDIKSLFFTNATNGYGVSSYYQGAWYGSFIKTTDGGANWTKMTVYNPFNSICFPDINTGYAIGYDHKISTTMLMKTTDAGLNWTTEDLYFSQEYLSIFFTDANTGYIVGQSGSIRKTYDGGITWSVQNSGVSDWLYSVNFINNKIGYIVGRDLKNSKGIILKTNNGGSSISKLIYNNDKVKIYPSHSSDKITIDMKNGFNGQITSLNVYNIQGQLILQQTSKQDKIELNISNLEIGLYILKIFNGVDIYITKFVKE